MGTINRPILVLGEVGVAFSTVLFASRPKDAHSGRVAVVVVVVVTPVQLSPNWCWAFL